MKKFKPFFLLFSIFIVLVFTCKKEYSFENPQFAKGSLQNDSTGNCLPKTAAGVYKTGIPLTDSNYMQVEVNITQPGTYTIFTDTVNGYYFRGSGTAGAAGLSTVNLAAFGTPARSGTDNFTVSFDSTICNVDVTVADTATLPAQYTLQGSPNTCMLDTLFGSYITNTPVTDSERIMITVNVSVTGSYTISTDIVNGYSFKASGAFINTGIQTVTLQCSGTPVNAGNDLFTVNAGSSVCSFNVLVLTPVIPPNPDHFPLTLNSKWSYNDILLTGDTITRKIDSTTVLNSNTYEIMNEISQAGKISPLYFRKSGDNYYEYAEVDKYTNSGSYITPVKGDILFAKEGLQTGDSWLSDEYEGPIQGGQLILLQYDFTCLNNNASLVVNGVAYSNIYVIRMLPQVSSVGGTYNSTGEEIDTYFAKGVGIVSQQVFYHGFPEHNAMQLKFWDVK